MVGVWGLRVKVAAEGLREDTGLIKPANLPMTPRVLDRFRFKLAGRDESPLSMRRPSSSTCLSLRSRSSSRSRWRSSLAS